jgi:hypothetical protein
VALEDGGDVLGADAVQMQVQFAATFDSPALRRWERAGGPAGHMAVFCRAPGCRSVWYRPKYVSGV